QVRIVPRLDGYLVEVVYEQQEEQAEVDQERVSALDPGVTVLAALTSTKPGVVPRLVSGKPLEKPQPVLQEATRKPPERPEPRAAVHLASTGSDHDEAHSPGRPLPAHGQPSDHRSVGRRGHRHPGDREKPALEAGGAAGHAHHSAVRA